MAAKKADEFISELFNGSDNLCRKKFSFTWNGENRIKNCKKIDLVGAYRLVLIHKDNNFILLYIGSHDECFRWIERNKGLSYKMDHKTDAVRIFHYAPDHDDILLQEVLNERRFVEEHEENLMKNIDDKVLLKIFSGFFSKTTSEGR